MTSVQTLPVLQSPKFHSTASPQYKPSPKAFKQPDQKMDGSLGEAERAPLGSTELTKENWTKIGPVVHRLLQNSLEFDKYTVKETINPEQRYKALNAGGPLQAKMEGTANKNFSYEDSPTPHSRMSTPVSTASTATDLENTIPSTHSLHSKPVDLKWPNSGNYKLRAKGFHNNGNTCFANSVLQVLMHTPPLLRMLDELDDHSGGHRKGGKICLTCELRRTKGEVWKGKGGSVNPSEITTNVKSICPTMRRGRQEDSHEFFRYSVDSLQNETLRDHAATKAPHAVRETSWVHKVWGGRLRSRVHCMNCSANSDTFDAFLDLSLDIGRDTHSVQDALKGFAKEDRLEGRNKYKCEKCKKSVNAIKSMKIVQAPPVLSLHLKRFTPFGRKISNLVDFKDTLTLQNPVFEGPPIEYELYGVTLHYGSGPNNGHYISIVRNESREWYQMDDSDVTRKSRLNDSDKKNTYQLHYIRRPGGKLNDILGQTSRNSVSQKPIQRPDLGRSYGASENVQPSNEPGTSEAHAKQTLMEKIRAREEASQASSRGLKRTRDDDSNDVGVPFVDPRRDQKKSKPTFAPMRGETFYANPKGKEKVASEDPDATDNEDAGEPIERDSPEKSGSGGGWDGAYDPDRQKAQISKPSFGFDSIGRGPQGSPGKRGRRRQAQSGRGKESPFMHSRNSNPNQKKFKGHAAMQPKHR